MGSRCFYVAPAGAKILWVGGFTIKISSLRDCVRGSGALRSQMVPIVIGGTHDHRSIKVRKVRFLAANCGKKEGWCLALLTTLLQTLDAVLTTSGAG